MNRRKFHTLAAATAVAAFPHRALFAAETSSVKIARIDLFPVRYPMTGYFKFFTGPHGSAGRAAVIVKITADSGAVGWGESVPIAKWSYETLETTLVALRDYFAPALVGRDPLDIEGALATLDQAIAPSFSTGMPITRAGVDIALHDLAGKLTGKSLPEMWGKAPGGSLTLSWTVNVAALDDVDELIDQGRQRGYRNFNIKVGPDPAFDEKLAQAVRHAAPDGFLWADANGGYSVDAALEAAPRLAKVGVDVLEAPLRPNQLNGYRRLKRQAALPILMDEGIVSPVELQEFFQLEMLDGVAMKPARCGGLVSNKRQIEFCIEHNLVWLGSGLTDPDISLAASLHLYAAFGLKKPAALNGP
ncbi:MAG: hypothetical protein KDA61_19560, partial [Planctomycetales bacterium]|nr:hypothetical protein [Planctomycetales bacterium]